MKARVCFFLACWLLIPAAGAQVPALQDFARIRVDPRLKAQAQAIVDAALRQAFGLPAHPTPVDLDAIFQKPRAVFVTFKSKDGVRGCMGSLQPRQASLQEEIMKQVSLALFHDPRHPRIQRDELAGMQVFITAVGIPSPVRGISEISPGRDGAYLRSGGKEAVVLPGEAKTQRYLLAFLKAKAGVKRGESFQLYRLPAQTLELRFSSLGPRDS